MRSFYGSTGGLPLNKPIVGVAATPDGQGYWLVGLRRRDLLVRRCAFYGSTGGLPLNKPIVGVAVTPDGRATGLWLGRRDLLLRRCAFYGSTGGLPLNKPIVGVAATPAARATGLCLRRRDLLLRRCALLRLHRKHALEQADRGGGRDPDGQGYWLVGSDGGIYSFGDAHFYGSTGSMLLNKPIVGVAATPDGPIGPAVGFENSLLSAKHP